MYEKLECIALRTVRYTDRNNILTAYSRQKGRVTFTVPAGTGRSALRMRALTMPLGRFECEAISRTGSEMMRMKDLMAVSDAGTAAPGPLSGTLSLFLAEVLASLLREQQPDVHLYDFIALTAEMIARSPAPRAANLHIAFLLRLQHFMGIEPDWATYRPGAVFDMADGIFRSSAPLHGRWIPSAEAEAAYRLRRMTLRNSHLWQLSRRERNLILDRLIQYYQIHFQRLGTVASLEVLRTVFS